MSVIKVNNITNRDGTSGPVIAGIVTVSSSSHFVVPVGNTFRRSVIENVVGEGLVLYLDAGNAISYPGSGTTWTDLSDNGNNGTLVNGVGYNSGNGGSLVFDGVDDNVSLSRVVQDDFTLSCWFKTTQSYQSSATVAWYNGAGLVDSEVGGVTNDFGMSVQVGKVVFGVGNPDLSIQSILTYNDNIFHNAVGTRNKTNGQINLYVDGVFVTSAVGNTNTLNAANNILVGCINNTQFFIGNIAQVSIYNRALSADEIQQNYNSLKDRYV
jgi:hypothetical protein